MVSNLACLAPGFDQAELRVKDSGTLLRSPLAALMRLAGGRYTQLYVLPFRFDSRRGKRLKSPCGSRLAPEAILRCKTTNGPAKSWSPCGARAEGIKVLHVGAKSGTFCG